MQAFYLSGKPFDRSPIIVVSPVRFRPSPFCEAAAYGALFCRISTGEKFGLRRRARGRGPFQVLNPQGSAQISGIGRAARGPAEGRRRCAIRGDRRPAEDGRAVTPGAPHRGRRTDAGSLTTMPTTALTSAEISLPARAEPLRVRERIAALADTVDIVGLTDNHAGQARMSPLAAVALAREQGVRTIVHVSCRDRNRLALQSQVIGALALGSDGILCLFGDPVDGVDRVRDLTTTSLIVAARRWA